MSSARLAVLIASIACLPAACGPLPADGDPPDEESEPQPLFDIGTIAVCRVPAVYQVSPEDMVVSGGVMEAHGCAFAATKGEVHVTLANGDRILLNVAEWRDDYVRAYVPVPYGVLDQDASVVVVKADGVRSRPYPVRFFARRETRVLRWPTLVGACAQGASKERCVVFADSASAGPNGSSKADLSFAGWHHNFCCSGSSGTDAYRADLANGWRVGRAASDPRQDWDGVSARPLPLGDLGVCAALQSVGSFALRNESSGSTVRVEVDWQIGGSCSDVFYGGTILVNGPVGTDP